MFICLLVDLFVYEHKYTKITLQIITKLSGSMRYKSGENSFNFGADPHQGADLGKFSSPTLTLLARPFSNIFPFSPNNIS